MAKNLHVKPTLIVIHISITFYIIIVRDDSVFPPIHAIKSLFIFKISIIFFSNFGFKN